MPKILIIEDEEATAVMLEKILEKESYDVKKTSDGDLGLAQVHKWKPDLIVLDIMLPTLDGLSICRMVRINPNTSHIPIIMLTSRGMEGDKVVGLNSGADDYMVKPVALGEFLSRIRAVLRRTHKSHAAVADVLESSDLKLNLIGRRFYVQDQEVQLTTKLFDLLAELMRNKGAVLSRDLILTAVWGYDNFIDKRTVDVHIRWLREKIEEDPADPKRIVTIRGVGYRFEG